MNENKTVIVTGAGDAPCSEIAIEIARQGARVLLVDDEKDKLDAVRKQIEEIGGRAIVYICDVNDPPSASRLAKEIRDSFGCCQYLVNGKGGDAVRLFVADTHVKIHAEGSYVVSWVERKVEKSKPLGDYPMAVRRAPRLDLCI